MRVGSRRKAIRNSVERPHEEAEAGGHRVGQQNVARVLRREQDAVRHVHREGGDGGEGHVDAARDDDHHAADGEEAGHDEGAHQVDEVVAGEELTRPGLDQQAEGDDGGEDPGLRTCRVSVVRSSTFHDPPSGSGARPWTTRRASIPSSRPGSSSWTKAPSCITTIRLAQARTSGRSSETMMTASPAAASLRHQRVDVVLRADVDAHRGPVQDEDLEVVGQPAREDDLLLVPARERPHRQRRVPGRDRKLGDPARPLSPRRPFA